MDIFYKKRVVVMLMLSSMIVGCLDDKDTGVAPLPETMVSGRVVIGQEVVSGRVAIFSVTDGEKGVELASSVLSSGGGFEAIVRAPTGPVLLELSEVSVREQFSGRVVSMDDDELFRQYSWLEQGVDTEQVVSVFSLLATGLSDYYLQVGLRDDEAILRSNEEMRQWLQYEVGSVPWLDINDAANQSTVLSDSLRAGFMGAAVSLHTVSLSRQLWGDADEHLYFHSLAYVSLLQSDISFDGVLNGIGSAGQLYVGSLAVSNEFYRYDLGINLLSVAMSPVNQTGIVSSQLHSYAIHISSAVIDFLKGDSKTIEETTFEVVWQQDYEGKVFSGVKTFVWNITSYLGLNEVSVQVDGAQKDMVYGAVEEYGLYKYEVDTTLLAPGTHHFMVLAEDVSDTIALSSFSFVVNNESIQMLSLVPIEGSVISKLEAIDIGFDAGTGLQVASVQISHGDILGDATYYIYCDLILVFRCPVDLSLYEEGEAVFGITAENNALPPRIDSFMVSYTIDRVSPTVAWFDIEAGNYLGVGDAGYIVVSDTHLSTVAITVNGSSKQSYSFDGAEEGEEQLTWHLVLDSLADGQAGLEFSDGVKNIVVHATDIAGNQISDIRKIIIDTIDPEITVGELDDSYNAGFSLTGTITDSNIDTLRVLVNGEFIGHATIDAGEGEVSWSYQYTPTNASDGDYQFTLEAIDKAGNETTFSDESISFLLDTTLPMIEITGSAPSMFCLMSLDGTVKNDALDLLTVNVSGQALSEDDGLSVVISDDGMSWTTQWQADAAYDGQKIITLTGQDKSGNASTNQFISLIDCTPAEITNITLPDIVHTSFSVSVSASDLGSGLSSAEVWHEDTKIASTNFSAIEKQSGTVVVNNASVSSVGTIELQVTVSDYLGNTTAQNIETYVDAVAPQLVGSPQGHYTATNHYIHHDGMGHQYSYTEYTGTTYSGITTYRLRDVVGISHSSCSFEKNVTSNSIVYKQYTCARSTKTSGCAAAIPIPDSLGNVATTNYPISNCTSTTTTSTTTSYY